MPNPKNGAVTAEERRLIVSALDIPPMCRNVILDGDALMMAAIVATILDGDERIEQRKAQHERPAGS